MNIQFNIMDGLEKVRKKDFIKIFIDKYPNIKGKELEKELTAINKDYGISLYHNKGFLFKWIDLKFANINWGDYISSFNIDSPEEMVTVGGNYEYHSDNKRYDGMTFGIHPNIYRKPTIFKFPTVKNGNIIRMCFYAKQIPAIKLSTNLGKLHEALQIPKNMFITNEAGDGLWYGFSIVNQKKCSICDEMTNLYIHDYIIDARVYTCEHCQENK